MFHVKELSCIVPYATIPKTPPTLLKDMCDRPSTTPEASAPILSITRKSNISRYGACSLLDLILEGLTLNEVGDLVVISLLLALLEALVALGKLAQRGKRVRSQLVQDTGNELRQLLVLTVAVDGEGVRGNRGVDWRRILCQQIVHHLPSSIEKKKNPVAILPLGAAKWMTLPSLLNMLTSSMAWMGWTLSFFSDC